MAFPSCEAFWVPSMTPISEMKPGEFKFYHDDRGYPLGVIVKPPGVLWPIRCPVTRDKAKADKAGNSGTFWHWNGSKEKPTLHPSIGVRAERLSNGRSGYEWHGYLTDGEFRGV